MASLQSGSNQEFSEKLYESYTENLVSIMIAEFPRSWGVDEPRRHWEMLLHCERAMYPRPMPNLALPSREARFYWHLYSASAKHQPLYQRNMNLALLTTLNKILRSYNTSRVIVISEQLLRADTFDPLGRRDVIDRLEEYIRRQNNLETFCIEGLLLKRKEGLRLVSALENSRQTLRSLYCWRTFGKLQVPMGYPNWKVCSISCSDYLPEKGIWYQALTSFEALTTLALNYSYIATPSGDLLLELAKKLGSHWQWLQLLCQEYETPTTSYNPKKEMINYSIPDLAWKATRVLAPALRVQLVFIDIPEYDKHKRFFTKHTPVHTFNLSTGIDLGSEQPWFIDCTIRTLWSWFPDNLVYLYLQLWHHREDLDHLFKKLFINLPELRVFEFIGEIRNSTTLCTMCSQIQTQQCKVNHVNLQLQDIIDDSADRKTWTQSIECLLTSFKQEFTERGVRFYISYYHC